MKKFCYMETFRGDGVYVHARHPNKAKLQHCFAKSESAVPVLVCLEIWWRFHRRSQCVSVSASGTNTSSVLRQKTSEPLLQMATPGGSGQGQPLSNEWQDLGLVDELKKMKCRRMWAEKGSDVALFCITEGDKERFFVTNAKCPHENGPLDQGDIEDMGNGKYKLICPIHFYTFDLDTGISETHAPMQVAVFPTETRDGHLFVKYPEVLSKKNPKKRPSRF